MKSIFFNLDDEIFNETERILSGMKISRNKYINDALEWYNKFQRKKMMELKLISESEAVRKESLSVLKEFEDLEDKD
ncbi:MAG: hypothetical protein KA780_09795 [Prolixibacteraceae bacterium]|jgi:hypothetical protein|nr:hypothetical protein [Prolixibacteraceae bacterium]NLX27359.1 hypothetical protein [Bacteroidales bacterium]HNQ37438.1 hypothetical protein [Prolixibacteraceae bacterium]HOY51228.1 hypothetical protein [Prolixibacteraceae bacterium]